MTKTDFLVIGSGPAGQHAAIQAAKLGKQSILVERNKRIGGVTVHTGTIPSKTLREAILYLTGWRQRGFYGRDYRVKRSITIDDLAQRLGLTIRHEIEVIEDQLHRNGIKVVHGTARFVGPNTMEVEDGDHSETIQADRILLATGTQPRRPDDIPFDDETIIDSDSLLRMNRIPHSAIVFGAGVIGMEYASMFNALDVEITLVNEHEEVLPFIDREIMGEFIHHLRDRGMRFHLGDKLDSVRRGDDGQVIATFASGRSLSADVFLFAAGRIGCTSALHLDKAGLAANARHQLEVNKDFQTAVPHIYAAGDLIGFPSLASTSIEQGRLAARHAFDKPHNAPPDHFPYGIYSVPEISMIGKTEQELVKEGIGFEIGTARLRETARGQIVGLREGLLKLIIGLEDHKILGVHIVGEGATELIHIGQAVMILGGTLEYFVDNAFNYPTLAETYKIAALDAWNRIG
ncbi:MAG: Si-specific NAD(P)(+) transhydrogenase [Acidiferrobacteraceae bacterium]|jgi:NAD(P) transhydrogenase